LRLSEFYFSLPKSSDYKAKLAQLFLKKKNCHSFLGGYLQITAIRNKTSMQRVARGDCGI